MKTNNIFAKSALLAIAALSFAACSEKYMDDINRDYNHSTDANAKFIIPDLELRTAQNVVGGDLNTYFGAYVEHWEGCHNQLHNAEHRGNQIIAASTYNNNWSTIYENIRNAKIIVNKCSQGGSEDGDDLALAIGEIMLAYNAAVVTDVFGNTPFSQVGDYLNFPNPDLDTQENIYKDIFGLLDNAIELLAEDPANTVGASDFIYNGDAESWMKFAFGLKARYTMRLINRSADKDADYAKIIEFADNSFESADEEASLNVYDASNCNPLFDFQWSRDGICSSKSMYNKLKDLNDPRINHAYEDGSDWYAMSAEEAGKRIVTNGTTDQCQGFYPYDVFFFSELADVNLLSYHELMFIKAEAQVALGQDATDALKEGIEAGLYNFNENVVAANNAPSVLIYGGIEDTGIVPDSEIEAYSASIAGKYAAADDNDKYSIVLIQKYIAMWGANGESTETYNDVRRLKSQDNDVYSFLNAGKFPLRAGYGTDDTSSNPYVQKAFGDGYYVYTENVWWAGGSR